MPSPEGKPDGALSRTEASLHGARIGDDIPDRRIATIEDVEGITEDWFKVEFLQLAWDGEAASFQKGMTAAPLNARLYALRELRGMILDDNGMDLSGDPSFEDQEDLNLRDALLRESALNREKGS